MPISYEFMVVTPNMKATSHNHSGMHHKRYYKPQLAIDV